MRDSQLEVAQASIRRVLIDDSFLGKFKPGSVEDDPFFRELRPTNFPATGDFEACAYRAQHWQGHVVFGGQDAVHGQSVKTYL